MSNHVFVSHSHDDAAAADLIVKALEERGVVCWIAPRDVEAGGSYAESIIDAIENACCFVLIYSRSCNFSSHVMREVERALKFGINIVPVRFDDSTPSKSLDYLLATVHWLAIAPDQRDRSVIRAAEQILAVVAKSQRTSATAAPNQPAPSIAAPVVAPPRRSPLWIGAAVALALVAGLIWFFVSRNSWRAQSAQKDVAAPSHTASRPGGAIATTANVNQTEPPLAVMHRYFDLLGKRDANAAFNLLSENLRRRLDISLYSKNVDRLPRVKLVDAAIVSQKDRTASATATFADADPDSHQAQWQNPIGLVLDPGGWRIDSMKGLIPASGRPLAGSANTSDEETTPGAVPSTVQSNPAPETSQPDRPHRRRLGAHPPAP
jgi:hypothetical protein